MEGFPSGQRDQTVNLTRWFEPPPPPFNTDNPEGDASKQNKEQAKNGRLKSPGWLRSKADATQERRAARIAGARWTRDWERRGYSSVVEPQPSKLLARVRFATRSITLSRFRANRKIAAFRPLAELVRLASVLITSVLAVEIGDKQQAVSSRQQIGRKFI